MKENAPADEHDESDVTSDEEAVSTHRDAGHNTNMGPVTEHLKLSDDERGSDKDMPELLETESSGDEGEDGNVEDKQDNWEQPAQTWSSHGRWWRANAMVFNRRRHQRTLRWR